MVSAGKDGEVNGQGSLTFRDGGLPRGHEASVAMTCHTGEPKRLKLRVAGAGTEGRGQDLRTGHLCSG